MSRRTLAALVVGWLLGIVTALLTPTLVWQRQTFLGNLEERAPFEEAIRNGWYILRVDGHVVTTERPRFRLP